MNRYTVHPEILERHPGYVLGVLWITGVRNGPSCEAIQSHLRVTQADLQRRIQGNPAEHGHIRCWREAFRTFGAKPSEHRSAVEALLRRALKPQPLPAINLLVDIGTLACLRHLLPVGVHPVPDAGEPVDLRLARAGDDFVPTASAAPECPEAGEIVLASSGRVLARRWTWRQSALSQAHVDTTDVFFNIDGLAPASRAHVQAAMQEIAALVRAFCGGEPRMALLDQRNPSTDF